MISQKSRKCHANGLIQYAKYNVHHMVCCQKPNTKCESIYQQLHIQSFEFVISLHGLGKLQTKKSEIKNGIEKVHSIFVCKIMIIIMKSRTDRALSTFHISWLQSISLKLQTYLCGKRESVCMHVSYAYIMQVRVGHAYLQNISERYVH